MNAENEIAVIDLERLRRQQFSVEEAAHAADEVERLQAVGLNLLRERDALRDEVRQHPLTYLARELAALTDAEREIVSKLSGLYIHAIGEPF